MFLLISIVSSVILPITCLNYNISTTWNGLQVRHPPVELDISSHPSGDLTIFISAPLFLTLDLPPGCVSGKAYPGLWNYEVNTYNSSICKYGVFVVCSEKAFIC